MADKTIKELSVELTVEITSICDTIKGRSVFTNQIMRSCSSIGANSYEAKYAQSKADFINKMEIALKECYETEYWLEILHKVNSLDTDTYNRLSMKCGTIRKKLIASINTVKNGKRDSTPQKSIITTPLQHHSDNRYAFINEVHIRRLREKIEPTPSKPEYILTKWGVGYYFTDK